MRRRSFLKAMVAAAAGCLALASEKVLSTRDGTLKPAWTEEQQKAWNLEDIESLRKRFRGKISIEPGDETWNLEFAAMPIRPTFRVTQPSFYAPCRTHTD